MPTISNAEIELMALLEENTGARAKDVVLVGEDVVFVVGKGELGKAIGKGGANIRRMRAVFRKNVEVVEEADDLRGFLTNFFKPARVTEFRESGEPGRKVVSVTVNKEDKGAAIGRAGERIKKARVLAKREYGCDDIRIV